MATKYNPQRMLNILNDIYDQTKERKKISITSILKPYRISTYVTPVLVEGGILKQYKRGVYEWRSIHPNIQMANKVVEKLYEKHRKVFNRRITNKIAVQYNEVDDIDTLDHDDVDIPNYSDIDNELNHLNQSSFGFPDIEELTQEKPKHNTVSIHEIFENYENISNERDELKQQVFHLELKFEEASKEWSEETKRYKSQIDSLTKTNSQLSKDLNEKKQTIEKQRYFSILWGVIILKW